MLAIKRRHRAGDFAAEREHFAASGRRRRMPSSKCTISCRSTEIPVAAINFMSMPSSRPEIREPPTEAIDNYLIFERGIGRALLIGDAARR